MLTNQFLQYINKEKLFKPTDKLLLAISGGLDSVILAHLLKEISQPFALAHMNFQLRGDDAEKDEKFVHDLARDLEVVCHIKKVNVEEDIASQSIQMQARELRYDWFNELLVQEEYQYILTAHHLNDSFETSLINLSRGTGIKGVRGIKPKQNKLIRPLLFATKSELLEYAKAHGTNWREDYTNATDKYKRNFIRHQVTPLLEKQNPNLLKHFQLTSKRLMAAETAYLKMIAEFKVIYLETEGEFTKVNRSILLENEGDVYLYELVKKFGFSFAQIAQFDFTRVGAVLYSLSYQLLVDRSDFIISAIAHNWQNFKSLSFENKELKIDNTLFCMNLTQVNGHQIDKALNNNIASLDADLLSDVLELRLWKAGDKFQPLGMKGQKKVSDYLIDEKVPLSLKERQLVLTNEDDIVWLVGHQIDDKYKVSKHTQRQLRLSYKRY